MKQLVQNRMRAVVTSLAGFMAVWAYAGAIGLIGGGVDLDAAANQRLPFHSPVFAGIALAVVLGIPMTVAAWSARHAPAETAIVAGAIILGWILIEIVIIRVFNGLQAFCLAYGIFLTALGTASFKRGRLS